LHGHLFQDAFYGKAQHYPNVTKKEKHAANQTMTCKKHPNFKDGKI
jgi:hypothetical protein